MAQKNGSTVLRALIVVLYMSTSCAQNLPNHAQDAGAKGSDVVESVIATLRDSCLLSDETDFLRRLAYVETKDGTDYMTYRQGYDGGVWQVDRGQFERTKIESARLSSEYSLLKSKLNIDWFRVRWSDLLKPLYSGIAAALLLKLEGAPDTIPKDVSGQANFWQQKWRTGSKPQDFISKVNILEQNCVRTNKLDILFLIDTSSNVMTPDWLNVQAYLKDMIAQVDKENGLGAGGDRIALVTYSNRAILAFPFGKSTDSQSLQVLVDLAPRVAGTSNTSDALLMGRSQVLPAGRTDADKVIVLITNGKSDNRISALQAVVPLKNQGVIVHTIGVGLDISQDELEQISSVPVCGHARRISSYSDLASVNLRLGTFSCKAPQKLTPGEYTYPCTKDFVGQLPADGLGYAITIKVTDRQADLLASLTTSRPTATANDLHHTLVPSQPVVIQTNETRSLTIKIGTGGSGAARSCTGSYTLSVDFMGPKIQECNGYFMDLLVMWDTTLTPDGQSFQQMINLTTQLISKFDLALDKHRVGVVTFDQSEHSLLWLKDSESLPKVLSALNKLTPNTTQPSGPSDLTSALRWSRQIGLSLQHGARPVSEKTIIVFTKGVPANQAMVRQESQLLHNEGVRVVVVAVDNQFDDLTLTAIAGTPLHVEKVLDLTSLAGKLTSVRDAACGDVSVQCVEQGIARPCSPEDLVNSQYGDRVVGDRDLTSNPCSVASLPGLPQISRFPHPSQLDRFIICDSKNQAYVVLCPLGQLYNNAIKECEPSTLALFKTTTRRTPGVLPSSSSAASLTTYPKPSAATLTILTTQASTVTTTTAVQNPCTYNNIITGNTLHEYLPDRTKYIKCTLVPGKGNIESCPAGTEWIQANKKCSFKCLIVDASKGVVDCSLPNPCGGALVYYAHPTDVTKYIECNANQEPFLKSCPMGQIWKPLLDNCDIP